MRKTSDDMLWHDDAFVRALLETTRVGLFRTDAASGDTHLNDIACEMLGLPAGAVLGDKWQGLLHPDDRERVVREWEQAAESQKDFALEYRMLRPNGDVRWVASHGWPETGGNDGRPRFIGTIADITGHKHTEALLRQSEEKFRGVFDLNPIAIAMASIPDGAFIEVNRAFTRDFGYERDEFIGRTTTELSVWDDPARRARYLELMTRDGRVDSFEAVLRRKDGSLFCALVSSHLMTIDGAPFSVASMIDISDRRRLEAELRVAAERLSLATDAAQIGIFDADLVNDVLIWDERLLEMYGVAEGDFGGSRRDWQARLHPDDAPTASAALNEAVAGDNAFLIRYRIVRGDGEVRVIEANATVLRSPDGTPLRMIGTNWDVTERVLAERQVREARDHLEATLQAIPDLLFELDSSGRIVDYRAPRAELLVVPPEQFLGRQMDEVLPPEAARIVREAILEAAERGQSSGCEYELTVPAGKRWFELSVAQMASGAGDEPGFIALAREITGRKRAEDAVRESQARLASIVDHALDAIITVGEKQRILVYNAAAEAMFGWPAAEIIGQPLERLLPARHVASHHEHVELYGKSGVTARRMGEALEVTGLRADGTELPLEASISQADVGGRKLFTVIGRDISERQHTAERARLEAQLGEVRKMEAIGTLASGIAHDFNNLLGAVLGNTELALSELGDNHPISSLLEETLKASRRAAELVKQILTFGRQGQEPQHVTALRSLVEEVVGLARASLPPQVELRAAFGAEIPNVLANPTQIHQTVMNLCTNSGHAIGDRPGCIDVRLDSTLLGVNASQIDPDLEPGLYTHLSVRDTGEGMDAETQKRIFEPFFTTKPVGHGTGLGLSVVHGIVKAHGGAITVTSRPGEGTTFDLYFPAVGVATEDSAGASSAPGLRAGSGARVLYVDDEELLVSLGTRLLDRLGYEVSGHTDPAEALEAVRADPLAFDLVITDFNMPGLSGLDLAHELAQLRPELPVVLISGYVTDELRAKAALSGVRRVLQKPSPLEELINTIHQLTDTAPQP